MEESLRFTSDAVPPLYVSLLGSTKPSERAMERAGYSRSHLHRELPRLAELGMIRLLEKGYIEVIPPETALPAYALHLEQTAARSRNAVEELTARFQRSRAQREAKLTLEVRVTADLTELAEARRRVIDDAEESITVVAAHTPFNEHLLEQAARQGHLPGGLGLTSLHRRLVLDKSMLDVAGTLELLEQISAEGIDVRIHPSLALSLIVVDRAVAIVDVTNLDPSGHGSLVIRHPPLVEALARLGEAAVLTSAKAPLAGGAAQTTLGARESRTLALLGAGLSDASIARQTGMSQRTVERHVRKAMDLLGASTRFQAGVEAARRGLI